jgi:hypothetical protein
MITPEEKEELLLLMEEASLSEFERRKRRLHKIPMEVVTRAITKARKGEKLTREKYIAANFDFLPGELIPERRERDNLRYERAMEESRQRVLDEWRRLRLKNPLAGGDGVTRMIQEAADTPR